MKRKQSVKRGPILKRCRRKVLSPTFFAHPTSFPSTCDSLLLSSRYALDRRRTNSEETPKRCAQLHGDSALKPLICISSFSPSTAPPPGRSLPVQTECSARMDPTLTSPDIS